MARMIPTQCPPDTASHAERSLFDVLRDGLPASYTVFHSLPWLAREAGPLREGECDYLIFHPAKGLLALEAKTGVVGYRPERKTWLQDDGTGRLKDIQDPVLQAEKSMHRIVKNLRAQLGLKDDLPLPYGYAAALPDARKLTGKLPPHVREEVLLLAGDLANVERSVERRLRAFARPGAARLSPELAQEFLDALLPVFRVVQSLAVRLEGQERDMLRLTDYQTRTLEAMAENPRLIVRGHAGSGKTILAFAQAARLDAEGASVLLLCFNRALAQHVRTLARERRTGIRVANFHGLCDEAAQAAGMDFTPDKADPAAFWQDRCPEILLEARERIGLTFDAVLVDEAQDFHPHWWVPVEALLADPDESPFYIFHDPNQNLFDRSARLPFNKPAMKLPFTCRNTRQIAEAVADLSGVPLRAQEPCVEGPPVTRHRCSTDEEERDLVRRLLHDLVVERGLDATRIVILHPHTRKNSCFAGLRRLGNLDLFEGDMVAPPNAVRYATIRGFKGLEADCVILCGVRTGDEMCSPADLYTGASRAKHILHVVRRS